MASFFKEIGNTIPLVYLQPQVSTTGPGGILGGGAITNVGTISHPAVTYGNATALGTRRTNYSGSTSSGSGVSLVEGASFWYGANSGDGFDVVIDFADPSAITVGESAFVGIMASPAALAGDASALTNCIGIGYDSGDALVANWSLITNNAGTAVKTSIPGMGRSVVLGHQLQLRLRSVGTATVDVILTDKTVLLGNTRGKILLDTTVGTGTSVTAVPAVETLLGVVLAKYNGAVAAASQLQFIKLQVSTNG